MSSDDIQFRDELAKRIQDGQDLAGFDFRGRFLSGVRFYYRETRGSDPIAPRLDRADFRGAVLSNCDFLDGRLKGANFTGADMRGSYLFGADLQGAIFEGAFMDKCHLYGSDLTGACLNKATCRDALISACEMCEITMIGADCRKTSFKDSKMTESNFAHTNFEGAYLEGALFCSSRIRNANFSDAVMFRSDLGKVDGRYASFRGAILGKYDTEVGKYYGANMGRGDFSGSDFRDAELVGVNLHAAIIIGCNFRGANLRGANMYNVKIDEKTNLYEANLAKAKVKNIDFTKLRLGGVNLFETMIDLDEIPDSIWEERQGDFIQAWEAYMQLKNNFKSIGNKKGERWAGKKERRLRGICMRLMNQAKQEKEKVLVK